MKKYILALSLLALSGCSQHFVVNGLMCPVDDEQIIQADLQECKIYDMDKIDIALQNGECKRCLEAKGYTVDSNTSK